MRNQLRSEYVYCDSQRRPFNQITKSFQASLRRAGIGDFRFHESRHTLARHFAMRRGSLKELQGLLGHKTLTMGYAHLSLEHKKKAVNLLNGLTAPKVVKSKCHIFKIQYFKGWLSY